MATATRRSRPTLRSIAKRTVYDSASVVASATEPGLRQPRPVLVPPQHSDLATVATVLALLLGIGLRLWRPDLGQINFDESNVASLIGDWKYGGAFPLVGTVSSYGFRAAQGWPWFAALGLLPTDDPYALLAIGIGAGVAGFIACWWVARRWLGPWGGVAAALFHGTMFYCVLLERGAWQPVFLQAPMALCLDALLRLGVQRKPWALAAACGWLGVLVSVHYTAIAFVLVVPLAAWYARSMLRFRHLAAAALVGLLPLMPFLVYQANPTVHFNEVTELLSLSRGTSTFDFDTVTSTIQIATTDGAAGLGGHAWGEMAAERGRWTNLTLLGPLLAACGLVVAVIRRPGGATGYLIAAWALAPIVAYLRHSAPVIFHYMFLEFPGLSFAVRALGAWAASSRSAPLRPPVRVAVAALAAADDGNLLMLFSRQPRQLQPELAARPLLKLPASGTRIHRGPRLMPVTAPGPLLPPVLRTCYRRAIRTLRHAPADSPLLRGVPQFQIRSLRGRASLCDFLLQ